jgi:hypothetical protein
MDISDPTEQIFQIRTHLLYELKWLISAAARFAEEREGDPGVALLDSAAVHARNLFEFAERQWPRAFTLCALGGEEQAGGAWAEWANQYVMHMHYRESQRMGYPDGVDHRDPERLMKMADYALTCLEEGGRSIPEEAHVKEWFDKVVDDARAYWQEPTTERHDELQRHYDASRDDRDY